MRQVMDTFLHLLSDNLPVGITVHPLRKGDANDPSTEYLKGNSVNVQFLDQSFDAVVSDLGVSISVLNDSELTAVDWVTEVSIILTASFTTPLMDYATGAPVPVRRQNIAWDRFKVKFRKVHGTENYAHYSCDLKLYFHL